MKKCTAAILIVIAVSNSSLADNFALTGEDLTWNPLSDTSPTFVIGIANPDNLADPLFGWSLGLEIVPAAGAIGSLEFASATLPDDYLLDGRSDGLVPPFSPPDTTIRPIADSDSEFTGIVVPASGKNLLALTFAGSPDIQGQFQILAVPELFTGSNWFSADFENAREFGNVPFDGDPFVLGTVTIVPEPAGVPLAIAAFLTLIVGNRGRFSLPGIRSRHVA